MAIISLNSRMNETISASVETEKIKVLTHGRSAEGWRYLVQRSSVPLIKGRKLPPDRALFCELARASTWSTTATPPGRQE